MTNAFAPVLKNDLLLSKKRLQATLQAACLPEDPISPIHKVAGGLLLGCGTLIVATAIASPAGAIMTGLFGVGALLYAPYAGWKAQRMKTWLRGVNHTRKIHLCRPNLQAYRLTVMAYAQKRATPVLNEDLLLTSGNEAAQAKAFSTKAKALRLRRSAYRFGAVVSLLCGVAGNTVLRTAVENGAPFPLTETLVVTGLAGLGAVYNFGKAAQTHRAYNHMIENRRIIIKTLRNG